MNPIKLWQKDRLGMFIHWGIYSMVGINEWCRLRERISEEDYQFLIDHFDPDLFDPAEWARAAKKAGMKYVVFTTKHHDGFCMWDSKFTDYKVTNSPCRRDLLKEIVAAFRAEGIKIGLYYSINDWHHPDYLITEGSNHALDHLPAEEIAKLNEGSDMKRYARYMRDQVRELLTEFGEIVEFWFDVSGKICPVACESAEMLKLIRSLQPDVILNNRLSIPNSHDILTPEGYVRDSDCVDEKGNSVPWEGCHCLTAAWGYNRDEKSYFKTPFRCLEILITQTSMNGNTLMNIGPTSRGYICDREVEILEYFAHWMKHNSRSIYGCGAAPKELPQPPADCRYTYNSELNRLYVHLMRWPTGTLVLHGLAGKVKYAQLLCDGTRMTLVQGENWSNENLNPRIPADAIGLRLMTAPENMPIPVIECFLNAEPEKQLV
ncbi:MAG: alpha-L-fucosidase [Terrimicrobiaceae bacterium]